MTLHLTPCPCAGLLGLISLDHLSYRAECFGCGMATHWQASESAAVFAWDGMVAAAHEPVPFEVVS